MAKSVVVSGAPGTGKSTVAEHLARGLRLPELSLDFLKETLADVLGGGDDRWSDSVGDAAAEVIFRLSKKFDAAVAEGWWRGQRRVRAVAEFAGFVEVFCYCEPTLAARRFEHRRETARHPIHRDVNNPALVEQVAHLAAAVEPLSVGPLVRVDTSGQVDWDELLAEVGTLAAV